jgi:AcrR family transcriptional regulator
MEAVAIQSSVSKPTLYRHWTNAQQLAMAAFVAGLEIEGAHISETARPRLTNQLETLIETFAATREGQVAIAIASADPGSEHTSALRNRVLLTSREIGRDIFEGAVNQTEFVRPNNLDALLDMIYRPIFHRLFMGHLPLNKSFAVAINERIW